MQRWALSQASFDQFLDLLDPDRDAAGLQYEALRTRVIKFFEWRSCSDADSLADESFDRVIRKISQGEDILDISRYMFGVAKLVYLESSKRQQREEPIIVDFPVNRVRPGDGDDAHLDCLEKCMSQVSSDNRNLILRYYSFDRQAKIDDRKRLADSLGLTLNALRIRALRIRAKIEECVMRCLDHHA